MRLASIASGSSGNCVYVGDEQTHILIDAGISNKKIEAGLNELGITGRELMGVFVTHEHSDHIKGLGVLARKHGLSIFGTQETLDYLVSLPSIGVFEKELLIPLVPDQELVVGSLRIKPFSVDHDAKNPVAYRVHSQEKSVAVVTDIGHFHDYTIACLQGLDGMLLEANHDVNMLQAGSYPYHLKQRILSDKGHLSNENAGRLLSQILHADLKGVLLGHISHENNYEELAFEAVKLEVNQADNPYQASDFSISITKRDGISKIIQI